ncbi:MAG TPA: M23 family metallopeptidase [Candidatus Limnocylindrales bacterium]|nr:M23 family metallopeptidase [Candidatus Limnocylindrales bacterium]
MPRSAWKLWLAVIVVPALLIVAGISYLAWRQSVPGVRAELAPIPRYIGVRTPLTVVLTAAGGGVKSAELRLVQGQGRVALASQIFTGGASDQRLQLTVEGKSLGLREGAATLEVFARDGYWRPLRVDDRPVLSVPIILDFTPPALEVLASTRYLAQGGGGLVVFRAKGASRTGVTVGGLLLPAYPVGPPEAGVSAAMVAIAWNSPTTSPVAVVAQDEAGNGVTRAVPVEIKPRRFPTDVIDLTDAFLAAKLPELLPGRAILPDQVVPAFLSVNRDQRKAAEQIKRDLAARTQPRPLWEGAFVQPRNTKVFSNFAETRAYRFQGMDIDTQVHLGYDLASVKHSPVPAANAGIVVYAAPLTIYGNTVVVDHGLGLQTLYAHLSSFDVKDGQEVTKGHVLGRTGTTGLAVGDHLHYEVLIQGIPVTPLEWWDGKWIRDHIGKPLREANVPVLLSEQTAPAAEDRPAARKRRGVRTR